ncbi:hypothetical protein RND81_02G078800 [Saponaria officinalis]|uniref:Uncharacterized protein n=1 Tax=Saponaria officinalis TaxID=3572 RepID=A0AAW1MWP1_SAPOF
MTYWDDEIIRFQREIDMIKNHAPHFVARLNLIMPETVYMNFLNCTPPLTMLNSIISGNANDELTPPILNNVTIEICLAKDNERRMLRGEVVEIIRRLFNVMKYEPLYDLLSGNDRYFLPRERVHYCDVYDDVTMEEELEYLNLQDIPPDRLNYSSDNNVSSDNNYGSDDDGSY